MAAGGGRRQLKVEIIGDATSAVAAAKKTEHAVKELGDQADKTDRKLNDISGSVLKIGGSLGKTAGLITGFGATASLAVGGIATAALGAIGLIGAIGTKLITDIPEIADAFGYLSRVAHTHFREVAAAFLPVIKEFLYNAVLLVVELKPHMEQLFNTVAPMLDMFGTAILDTLRQVVPMLGSMAEAARPLFEMLTGNLAPVLTSLVGTITSAAQIVGGPLAGALNMILPTLAALIDTLVTAFGPAAAELFNFLGPAITTIGYALGSILKELGPALTEVFNKLGPPIQKVLDALAPLLPLIADLAGTVLVALADALAPVIDALAPFITQLVDQLKPVFEEIKPIITDLGQQLGPILADNISQILPLILDLTEALLPLVPPIVDFIAQLIIFDQKGRQTLIQFFKDAWHWLAEVVPPLFEDFKRGIQLIADKVSTAVGWIQDAWAKLVLGFKFVKEVAIQVWDDIWFKIESVVTFIQNLPATVWNSLVTMWDGLVEGFKSAINFVIDMWNGLSLRAPEVDLPGVGKVGGWDLFPDVPRLHTGGVFRAPTPGGEGLALLRDGERVSTAGQGGQPIYISVDPITGQVMVNTLTEHQRRGGQTPWKRVA